MRRPLARKKECVAALSGLLPLLAVACGPLVVTPAGLESAPSLTLFAPPHYLEFSGRIAPSTAALVQLDHDPWKDLLVYDTDGKALLIYDGQYGGVFSSRPRSLYTGFSSSWLRGMDFSGDGKMDLVLQQGGERSVFLLQGDGQGSFAAQQRVPLDAVPQQTVGADLDGDGIQDLILTFSAKRFGLLHGLGHGEFAPISYYPTSLPASQIVLADLDGDKAPDVVLGEYDYKTGDAAFEIFLNDGRGQFRSLAPYPLEAQLGGLLVADVDGDCVPDVVLSQAGVRQSNFLFVYRGTGNGSLAAPSSIHTAAVGASPILAEDLDGDGIVDLAVSTTDSVALLLGRGSGSFAPPEQYVATPEGAYAGSMFISDQNLDGRPDIVLLTSLFTPEAYWQGGVMILGNQAPRRSPTKPACGAARNQ